MSRADTKNNYRSRLRYVTINENVTKKKKICAKPYIKKRKKDVKNMYRFKYYCLNPNIYKTNDCIVVSIPVVQSMIILNNPPFF